MSIELSLGRLHSLASHLSPYTRPTLHIAGTNGKGSVSAILTSILLASKPPLRVGRFNSPHLVSVLDSITVDNEPIELDVYEKIRNHIQQVDESVEPEGSGRRLSSFELLALTALHAFEQLNVDIVVLEVGMGGRLDATNVIPDSAVLADALTAVDLDHQSFLGDTVEAIAKEKAGIARPGRPFVLGKQKHGGVEAAVKRVLDQVGATLVKSVEVRLEASDQKTLAQFSLDLSKKRIGHPPSQLVTAILPKSFPSNPIHTTLPLHGAHQLDNLGIALTVIDELISLSICPTLDLSGRISLRTIEEGVRNVRWPGRLSFHILEVAIPSLNTSQKQPLLVLADGAHNPSSAETLGMYIEQLIKSAFDSTMSSQATDTKLNIHLTITFILSLSHSPPKTPLQTLAPILPPRVPDTDSTRGRATISTIVDFLLVPFTPPEGMPWIRGVPMEEMEAAVKTLFADAKCVGLGDIKSCDLPRDGRADAVDTRNIGLEAALDWVAQKRYDSSSSLASSHDQDVRLNKEEIHVQLGLVVLSGSLYLVADFYRILEATNAVT